MSIRVHKIHDGDAEFLVRGTLDHKVALDAIMDEYADWISDVDEGYDQETELRVEREGWFRMNPTTDPDYGWMLGFAKGPGRGNFQGIYCDVVLVPAEYEEVVPL